MSNETTALNKAYLIRQIVAAWVVLFGSTVLFAILSTLLAVIGMTNDRNIILSFLLIGTPSIWMLVRLHKSGYYLIPRSMRLLPSRARAVHLQKLVVVLTTILLLSPALMCAYLVRANFARFLRDEPGDPLRYPLVINSGIPMSSQFDIGVAAANGRTDLARRRGGYVELSYPAGLEWAAIYITAGRQKPTAKDRSAVDISKYRTLELELRGTMGGEKLLVGVKARNDPDDGKEPRVLIGGLSKNWQTIRIPLQSFAKPPFYPSDRLTHVYILCELVSLPLSPSQTIHLRSVRFGRQ